MRIVCGKNQCNGCYACISKCTKNAIHIEDNLKTYHAVIDEDIHNLRLEELMMRRNRSEY